MNFFLLPLLLLLYVLALLLLLLLLFLLHLFLYILLLLLPLPLLFLLLLLLLPPFLPACIYFLELFSPHVESTTQEGPKRRSGDGNANTLMAEEEIE